MDTKELAKRIVLYRSKNNLSMNDFAKLCNVTRQTIINIELCLTTPTRLTERKILNVIGDEENG